MTSHELDMSPAERRREKVKDSILSAAERVFSTEGETALSIRRLAEEIDYSPAAIYKYFSSKEDLIDALKEQFYETLQKRIQACLEKNAGEPFAFCFRKCLGVYIETALERPHHYATAFATVNSAECSKGDAKSWDEFASTRKGAAFLFLVDIVRQGQAQGVFREELDPYIAAKSVWASCHGLAHLLGHIPNMVAMLPETTKMSSTDFIAAHADLIFRGLTSPNSSTS